MVGPASAVAGRPPRLVDVRLVIARCTVDYVGRLSARLDYEINLRAELEIMRLHEKIDRMRIADLVEKVEDLSKRLDRNG